MGAASVGLGLEPTVGPHMAEQVSEPRFYLVRSPTSIHARRPLVGVPHHRASRQLALHVQEQFFGGDGVRVAPLCCGDGCPDHLDHVVQQQAEGELENSGLRRSADQRVEMKHLGDLLEHLLDTPTPRVQCEEFCGGILFRVQEVGQQNDVLFAGPQQRDAAYLAAAFVLGFADPAPVLDVFASRGVAAHSGLARWIGVKHQFFVVPHEEMIILLREIGSLHEVGKLPIGQPQSQPGEATAHLGQNLGHKLHVVGIAVAVGAHDHRQTADKVHCHQCRPPSTPPARPRSGLSRLATCLIAFPSRTLT